jgi:hypothetical protein
MVAGLNVAFSLIVTIFTVVIFVFVIVNLKSVGVNSERNWRYLSAMGASPDVSPSLDADFVVRNFLKVQFSRFFEVSDRFFNRFALANGAHFRTISNKQIFFLANDGGECFSRHFMNFVASRINFLKN